MRGRATEQGLIRHMLARAGGEGQRPACRGRARGREDSLLAAAGEARQGRRSGRRHGHGEQNWPGPRCLAALTRRPTRRARVKATGPEAGAPAGGPQGRLEELASAGPALISVDDVHWADPATLHALRSLPGLLAAYPLVWVLARDTHGGDPEAGTLFDVLQHTGGTRAYLAPLPLEAQAAVMRDVLGVSRTRTLADSAA